MKASGRKKGLWGTVLDGHTHSSPQLSQASPVTRSHSNALYHRHKEVGERLWTKATQTPSLNKSSAFTVDALRCSSQWQTAEEHSQRHPFHCKFQWAFLTAVCPFLSLVSRIPFPHLIFIQKMVFSQLHPQHTVPH